MIIIAEVSELTRKIKLPTDRVLSVNGDYQVDGIAFKLPATYEGDFDFSTAAARVHWTGVDKVEHTNLITEEDGNGYPLWAMPSELTQGGHGVIEFAVSFVVTDATAAVTKRWISDPVSFRNRRTVNGSNEDEEAEEEVIYDRLASAIAAVRAAQAEVEDTNAVLSSLTGSAPVPVENRADMVDDGHLYLYTGDETGLVTGNLYYYVNGTLTNGGQYGSMEVDATLTQSGQAADAAVTGAEISAIKEELSQNRTRIALSNPWEIGTFDPYNGAQRDNVYRLKNTQYIGFEFGDLRAICYNGLEFTLVAWDENETYIGMYANGSFSKSGGSFVETFDFSNFKNYHFMPLLRRKDSSAVETTDGLNFLLARHNTDQTLSQIGKNADAKITGDKIRAIEERIETDKTLTKHKRPADAKTVGDELDLIKEGYSLNDNIKDALLTIASNIAYINANGQIYYNVLRDALYPPQKFGYKYVPSNVVTGAFIDETGNIVSASASSGYYDDFINISYAKELSILYTAPSINKVNFRVSIYDSGLNFVRQIHYEVAGRKYGIVTINFDENEKFIKLGWYSEGTSIDPLSDIAFYLSSAADEMIMGIGSISGTTGEDELESRRLRSAFISVQNNLTVIGCPFGDLSAGTGWVARCYDASYAFIGSVPNGKLQSEKAVFNTTLPEGTAFIRFVYQNSPNAYTQGWSENIVEDFWVNGHRYRFYEE